MGSRGKHWTEAIADDLRRELTAMSDAARSAFAETRRPPKRPSRREQLKQFLAMDRRERLALFAKMGPEEYSQFIQKAMTDLVKLIGPAATALYPYLYADGIAQAAAQDDVASLESQLNEVLAGDDRGVYEPLLEDIENAPS